MLKASYVRFKSFGYLKIIQEIQRLQKVIAKVRFILTQLQQAIKGEVVMTEELQETLYAVYDAKVGQGMSTMINYVLVIYHTRWRSTLCVGYMVKGFDAGLAENLRSNTSCVDVPNPCSKAGKLPMPS